MKPKRRLTAAVWVCSLVATVSGGCTTAALRSEDAAAAQVVAEEKRPKLVGDYCRPFGHYYLAVQSPALVTGLRGTGSDPPPGPLRERLLGEMRRREVDGPNAVLASPNTSLVLVRAFIPPAARKGDRVDVEVYLPEQSSSSSLDYGWLMESRLVETAVLGNQLRTGYVGAIARGPILIDALLDGSDEPAGLIRGQILGGGVSTQDRTLGLMIGEEHHSVAVSALIGAAINRRFHTYDAGNKRGAAVPKRNDYIELDVDRRYRHNVTRYLRVIENIPVRPDMQSQTDWLAELQPRLLDRITAAHVALQLEALGATGVPLLNSGLESPDPEIRFYCAEALAYLDQPAAIPYLLAAARDESAFRWHALTALSTMSQLDARDALAELVHQSSAETRYGAFRALQAMNPQDPLVRGRAFGEALWWHEVASTAPPLIHVARSRRPEVVVFGGPVRLDDFAALFAGRDIMVKPSADGQVQVSYYAVGTDADVRTCSSDLHDVIQAVVEVGGTYAHVVRLLLEAERQKILPARLVFDALPRPGRVYIRDGSQGDENGDAAHDGGESPDDSPPVDASSSAGGSSPEELPVDRKSASEELPVPELFAVPSVR